MRDKRLGKCVRDALREHDFLIVQRPALLHIPPLEGDRVELYAYEGLCDTKLIQVKNRVLQIDHPERRDLFLKWMQRQYAGQLAEVLFDG